MRFTTSEMADVPADVRINLSRPHPLKFKRLFLGLHLDFSMHQMMLYAGLATLFIEIYPPIREEEATIDGKKLLWKTKYFDLGYHYTNHKPHDYFFNMGATFYTDCVVLFLWKLQFVILFKESVSQ